MKKQLSDCCKKDVSIASSDEGTNWYECSNCKKPCDLFVSKKKIEPTQAQIQKEMWENAKKEFPSLADLAEGKSRHRKNCKTKTDGHTACGTLSMSATPPSEETYLRLITEHNTWFLRTQIVLWAFTIFIVCATVLVFFFSPSQMCSDAMHLMIVKSFGGMK